MYVHVSVDSNWVNYWQLLSGCVPVVPQESTAVLDTLPKHFDVGNSLAPSQECLLDWPGDLTAVCISTKKRIMYNCFIQCNLASFQNNNFVTV